MATMVLSGFEYDIILKETYDEDMPTVQIGIYPTTEGDVPLITSLDYDTLAELLLDAIIEYNREEKE